MRCEVGERTGYSGIRYGQCWEDADVLVRALAVRPGDTCLSIASAGDNTLALLAAGPARVIALDMSPAQLACLELRVAAYWALSHGELLELLGSRPGQGRWELYQRCRAQLSPPVRAFWDGRRRAVERGIGASGRFEGYLAAIRRYLLPLLHSRRRLARLLEQRSAAQRLDDYGRLCAGWRWRTMLKLCASRALSGGLGRDRAFYHYAQGSAAGHIAARLQHVLTRLDPAANPYLHWILTGAHASALPYALRPEHFEPIRASLDRLEWHCLPLEAYLETCQERSIDRFNLSDIFEYISPERYQGLLGRLAQAGRPGARLAYWNMLVPRSRPAALAPRLRPLAELAQTLYDQDKAPFYSRFVLEEVLA
jgi:S-adenosylmethionine-diacylglycerol 3-amino-3-carboxypropyl transferase